ncbi:MarR family winged helix-turn-helix transcriptional regulator [Nocardia alni]|uniref:MarR family winged helix-turn-helix transcriptional regulator n=1 Tax=Nocardia alni TaxID=2815723 RepID=UPI001C21B48E|nr:hypothetical protein [Nocardia alni]
MHLEVVVSTPQPFGYWLEHIDRGIEESFVALLAADGLVRRSWQLLHTLAVAGPLAPPDLDRAVSPFLDESDPATVPYVEQLAERGWVVRSDDSDYALTAAGRTAHDDLFERAQAQRGAIMNGLTPADFHTLVDLLQHVAGNVDRLVHQANQSQPRLATG